MNSGSARDHSRAHARRGGEPAREAASLLAWAAAKARRAPLSLLQCACVAAPAIRDGLTVRLLQFVKDGLPTPQEPA